MKTIIAVSSLALVAAACSAPFGVDAPASTFDAQVTGSLSTSISGAASVGGNTDWQRQIAGQVTTPDGQAISFVSLRSTGGTHSITISKAGALAAGTFPVGLGYKRATEPGVDRHVIAYMNRRADGLQVFVADSGTVTVTSASGRLQGTFVMYGSKYDLLPILGPTPVGSRIIVPLARGEAPIRIDGSFDAPVR